jgi:putative molybdopterin biosynthesis protein
MREQEQFLQVLDRDEAERRFRDALDLSPRGVERVPLEEALGRVLAADVVSPVDVPSFDRSNVDGFAVVAADTFGASEERPCRVRLARDVIHAGVVPALEVRRGQAVAIATGGMMPRGADAVVMVEHADAEGDDLLVRRAAGAGSGVSFTGTDITAGETVLRQGTPLTSRDTGVLAAIGVAAVDVWRRPIVAILSTGDEIIPPDEPMRAARVYDSNAQVIADAVRELGGHPHRFGIVPDDIDRLRARLREAIGLADIVLLSGGTSKGAGDVSYRAVVELTGPGIVAHGVALKPGKPICLAATSGRPVVVLPGFPTSAIFTFHEFVAPVLRAMAGRRLDTRASVAARLAVRVNSEIGRTEYLLVSLVPAVTEGAARMRHDRPDAVAADAGSARRRGDGPDPACTGAGPARSDGGEPDPAYVAYPMGQGSGSVTTFSRADGFTTIGRHEEIVPAGTTIQVQLLGSDLELADLVVIGSHCVGLDFLLGALQRQGVRSKMLAVGSLAGLDAARRGECDIAGVHLLDPQSSTYNRPFLTPDLELIPGYGRLQGIVFRPGDTRFGGRSVEEAIATATADPSCVMVNRNAGSGTRALIDHLLQGAKPPGYAVQPRTHNAVAAAVAQQRADWGVTLDTIALRAGLAFIPVQHERYDFVTPKARASRPAVQAFVALLAEPEVRRGLASLGMQVDGLS